MIDPTPNEQDALNAAGQTAGEYLDSLGKTDLAEMEVSEWESLIESIITGYTDRLRELADRDQHQIENITNFSALKTLARARRHHAASPASSSPQACQPARRVRANSSTRCAQGISFSASR